MGGAPTGGDSRSQAAWEETQPTGAAPAPVRQHWEWVTLPENCSFMAQSSSRQQLHRMWSLHVEDACHNTCADRLGLCIPATKAVQNRVGGRL